MKKLVAVLVLFSVVITGCDRTKTIQKLEDIADELRAHNRSIAKITNDSHEAGRIGANFHLGVITACDGFSKALDTADRAVAAAKLVNNTPDAKGALDFAQRVIDTEVFPAFVDVVDSVVGIPPAVKAQIDTVIASIRLLFATIRGILAEAQLELGGRERYV